MRALLLLTTLALAGCQTTKAMVKGEERPATVALEGRWTIEDVNGGGVIDNAPMEIAFEGGDAGTSRVSGRAGCNRFTGPWLQTGNQLWLGPLATTRMACPPALMELEAKTLATLAAVRNVSQDRSVAVRLLAPDGRALSLRRATTTP